MCTIPQRYGTNKHNVDELVSSASASQEAQWERLHGTWRERGENISESDMIYGQVWWPILGICALQLTHPKCAHTQQWTHTRSSGQPFMLRRPGSSWGFGASRAPQSWYWRWRERCTFTPPTYNSCRPETRTRNLWITSPPLTIRPRLPLKPLPTQPLNV